MKKKKSIPKIPLLVMATAAKDGTYVYQNNKSAGNPWLKDSEKVPEPSEWEVDDSPLAALFKKPKEEDEKTDVLYKGEELYMRKMGRLYDLLKKTKVAFEYDYDEKYFRLSHFEVVKEKRDYRRKAYTRYEKVFTSYAAYVYDGHYWLTKDGDWDVDHAMIVEKSFQAFNRAFRDEQVPGLRKRQLPNQ